MKIVISSGHSKKVRGASGYLDEVDEARKVVNKVADILRNSGVEVTTFHDDTSTSQSQNLNTIVAFHNSKKRDLDVSVHFNAYQTGSKPMGSEVLYLTQKDLALRVCDAICAAAGWPNRGPKKRTDLAFLNGTNEPAILIETCFVDSKSDADVYRAKFNDICAAIAASISGRAVDSPEPPAEAQPGRPVLSQGASGSDVAKVQTSLGVPADGQFGPVTTSAVKGFQSAVDLTPDGIVGPGTWTALDSLDLRKGSGSDGLPADQAAAIEAAARASSLARVSWRDRGIAPMGYIVGMALSFGRAVVEWHGEDPTTEAMAVRATTTDVDALAWYRQELTAIGLKIDFANVETLRALWVLLIGLGMRESSGKYCEGRDLSASNVAADTAEAGLFQTSWNIQTTHQTIPPLLDEYWDDPNGFLEQFAEGVSPGSGLENFGTGEGATYQFLAKYAPCFAAWVTAVGLRGRRQHWGPINRKEVEVRREADELLRQVQAIIEAQESSVPPDPPEEDIPEVEITVAARGRVKITVNGVEMEVPQ